MWQVFPPDDRPDVEVFVEGRWCFGELRARQRIDGEWWAWITYNVGVGQNHCGTFPYTEVRPAGR